MKPRKRTAPKAKLIFPQYAAAPDSLQSTVNYIREFDKLNGLKSGNTYILGGKEVVV